MSLFHLDAKQLYFFPSFLQTNDFSWSCLFSGLLSVNQHLAWNVVSVLISLSPVSGWGFFGDCQTQLLI